MTPVNEQRSTNSRRNTSRRQPLWQGSISSLHGSGLQSIYIGRLLRDVYKCRSASREDRWEVLCFAGDRGHSTSEQEVLDWIQNNWRLRKAGGNTKSLWYVRKSDVIWTTRKDLVFKEIAILLNIDKADTRTPGWFGKRTPAIRQVLSKMLPEEKAQLDKQIKKIESDGYPEEQRRMYVRYYVYSVNLLMKQMQLGREVLHAPM